MMEIIHIMSKKFCEIIIECKIGHQPSYELLENKWGDVVQFYENIFPDIELYKDKLPHLVVFDDIVCDMKLQQPIGNFFVRGRDYNLNVCYLSQNFSSVPKIIR